ncbi:MAG: hypothetical protein ACQEWW_17800 [Bacillota bacterium]
MKRLMALSLFILLLSGCNTTENDKLKWFESEEEAITNGIIEESIKETDILGKVKRDGEVFVFFKQGSAINLANIAKKDTRYAWYRSNAYTEIGKSLRVEWDTITYSGKKFWVVVGSKKDDEGLNNAKEGSVLPETNNELGIYYTVVRGR